MPAGRQQGRGGGWGSLASNFPHKYSADPVCTKESGSKKVEGFGLIVCGLFLAKQKMWKVNTALRNQPHYPPSTGTASASFCPHASDFGASEVASRNQNTTTQAKITPSSMSPNSAVPRSDCLTTAMVWMEMEAQRDTCWLEAPLCESFALCRSVNFPPSSTNASQVHRGTVFLFIAFKEPQLDVLQQTGLGLWFIVMGKSTLLAWPWCCQVLWWLQWFFLTATVPGAKCWWAFWLFLLVVAVEGFVFLY